MEPEPSVEPSYDDYFINSHDLPLEEPVQEKGEEKEKKKEKMNGVHSKKRKVEEIESNPSQNTQKPASTIDLSQDESTEEEEIPKKRVTKKPKKQVAKNPREKKEKKVKKEKKAPKEVEKKEKKATKEEKKGKKATKEVEKKEKKDIKEEKKEKKKVVEKEKKEKKKALKENGVEKEKKEKIQKGKIAPSIHPVTVQLSQHDITTETFGLPFGLLTSASSMRTSHLPYQSSFSFQQVMFHQMCHFMENKPPQSMSCQKEELESTTPGEPLLCFHQFQLLIQLAAYSVQRPGPGYFAKFRSIGKITTLHSGYTKRRDFISALAHLVQKVIFCPIRLALLAGGTLVHLSTTGKTLSPYSPSASDSKVISLAYEMVYIETISLYTSLFVDSTRLSIVYHKTVEEKKTFLFGPEAKKWGNIYTFTAFHVEEEKCTLRDFPPECFPTYLIPIIEYCLYRQEELRTEAQRNKYIKDLYQLSLQLK